MHERAHNGPLMEKRGDTIISRGMAVFSPTLGVNGVCDVVEFHASPNGVKIFGREGTWLPLPVEYKKGAPKENNADKLQLCCQAMCLEEMLACPEIPKAYLYYGETAHRLEVELDEDLRGQVKSYLAEMHQIYSRQHTPKVKTKKSCNACSLKDLCLPKLCGSLSVKGYIAQQIGEDNV